MKIFYFIITDYSKLNKKKKKKGKSRNVFTIDQASEPRLDFLII